MAAETAAKGRTAKGTVRLFAGVLALVGLAAVLGGPAVGTSEARTIRVPAAAPSVTEAVAAAATGDTVLVAPGTYSLARTGEKYPILITKEMTILGQGDPAKCVMIPDSVASARLEREIGCFIVRDVPGGERVVIRGLTFEAPFPQEASTEDPSTAKLRTRRVGMDIYRAETLVDNCRFLRLDTGVRIGSGPRVRVTGCRAEGVGMPLTVTRGDAVFEKNETMRCRLGVDFEMARGVARGNRFLSSIRDGISVSESDSTLLEGNYIEGSARCAISLHDADCTVLANEIVRNKYGIWCERGSAPRLVKNVVRMSQGYDLGCEKGAAPVVGGTLAEANDFHGDGAYFINNLTDNVIDARRNFWGTDCPTNDRFNGQVRYAPWTDRAHAAEYERCR